MLRGLRGAAARFAAADGFLMGAGLAFFGLVCLIPLMLLMVSVLGFVLSSEQAANQVVGHLAQNFPVNRREIARTLLRIVETRRASGLVGTGALLLFSTQLFSVSRLVMHRLIGIRVSAGFLRNLLLDVGMIVVLSLLLFAATVTESALEWFRTLVFDPARRPLVSSDTTRVALSVAMFYLGYRYVPRRHIRIGAAMRGAVLAAVLWEIAKQVFRVYMRRVAIYDQVYGPLGALIAFVMFVYYSALVFVFGGAYAAALDSRRAGR
jgi:membrane protein